MPSRAIAWREVSRFSEEGRSRGLGSLARMLPRSKVYGVGLETVMGLLGVGVSIGWLFFDSLDLRFHFDIGLGRAGQSREVGEFVQLLRLGVSRAVGHFDVSHFEDWGNSCKGGSGCKNAAVTICCSRELFFSSG